MASLNLFTMGYCLKILAEKLDLKYVGQGSFEVTHLLIDSRRICFPEDSIFIALQGNHHDGHDYIESLIAMGVRAFVVKEDYLDFHPDCHYLLSANPLYTLQELGKIHRKNLQGQCVAITGSNGKTVVKEWLAQVLQERMHVGKTPRSYNSQIGVPLSLWGIDEKDDMAIIEAGISLPGEMTRLEEVIQPDWGIFCNIGSAHQSNFSSLKEKCREKMQLFKGCKFVVLCRDHHLVFHEACQLELNLLTWGEHEESMLRILRQKRDNQTCRVELSFSGETFSLVFPFSDPAAVENAMHVVCAALYLGLGFEELASAVQKLSPLAMRQEIKEGVRGCMLINDSYSSDSISLKLALEALKVLSTETGKVRVAILSDFDQVSGDVRSLYAHVATLAKVNELDLLIGIGQAMVNNETCFAGINTAFFPSKEALWEANVIDKLEEAVVLVKGARSFGLEHVVKQLEAKSYQTILEVDLKVLTDNYYFYKKGLNHSTGIIAMLKANAYGCGAVDVARHLQHLGCSYFGVALADEGVALRKAHIATPIIVMNPEARAFDDLVNYGLEPEIYSFELLQQFLNFARSQGLKDYPIHVKVDTGMHRLGFLPGEIERLGLYLQNVSLVRVKTVFSHLAAADDEDFDWFTRQQIDRFREACAVLEEHLPYVFKRHILNSCGCLRFPDSQMDYVRLGIGLYGIGPASELQLVSSLKTRILQVKDVAPGEFIGYTCQTMATQAMRVAILPIGYADGFDRAMSNGGGEVSIGGRFFPTVGRISMDMCVVDITGEDFVAGCEVVVWDKSRTPQNIAQTLGTIPYEVMTKVDERVKRVYINR